MVGQGPQPSGAPHAIDAAVHRPTGEPTSTVTSPFRWTERPPGVPGFYWARFTSSHEHREGSHVVEVRRETFGALSVWHRGEILYPGMGVLRDARWSDVPVPEPTGG